jgi:hypothetical protein
MSKLRFKPAYNPYTEPSMEIFRSDATLALLLVSFYDQTRLIFALFFSVTMMV